MSVSLYLCWNKNAISVEIFVLITDLFLEPITVPDIPGQIFQRGIPQSPAWSGSGRVQKWGERIVSQHSTCNCLINPLNINTIQPSSTVPVVVHPQPPPVQIPSVLLSPANNSGVCPGNGNTVAQLCRGSVGIWENNCFTNRFLTSPSIFNLSFTTTCTFTHSLTHFRDTHCHLF